MSTAVTILHVSKWFHRYQDRPGTLKETLLHGFRKSAGVKKLQALDDISLDIESGKMLGMIGANGAGKSTLLRLIGGVGRPDLGSIEVRGRIGALLDLGAGFHPDLTGRENIYISGVITGLTRREIAQRFDRIVDFSEIEDFIDSPLRTYSTGMQMRLAFAVAAHIDPEVLLVDEVLAVGDLAFQKKCLDRIAQFKREGTTIILVSHDISSIRTLCDDVLWLRRGKVAAYGPTEVVTGEYVSEMTLETQRRTPTAAPVEMTSTGVPLRINENRFGSMETRITAVRLLAANGLPVSEIDSGDPLCVEIDYHTQEPGKKQIFGVTLTRGDGFVCFDTSSEAYLSHMNAAQETGTVSLQLRRLDLIGGQYYVDVGIYCQDWSYAYDYHWHVYPLTVRPTRGVKGIILPPGDWILP